jgi:hypothetical protein
MVTINTDVKDVPRVIWEGLTTATSPGDAFKIVAQSALAGAVQVTGTFGGATVRLKASNDGTNFVTMDDILGDPVEFTAAGLLEFTTAAVYIRAEVSGGTGDDIDVVVCLRG